MSWFIRKIYETMCSFLLIIMGVRNDDYFLMYLMSYSVSTFHRRGSELGSRSLKGQCRRGWVLLGD